MKDSEIIALAKPYQWFDGNKKQPCEGWTFNTAEELLAFAKDLADPLQYNIDQLMLEYCPEEMTEDQKSEWAEHQVIFKGDDRIC